jgi:hypothetical protein
MTMRARRCTVATSAFTLACCIGASAHAGPLYNIYDLGPAAGDGVSQGFGVSPNGIATGRSVGADAHAFTWTLAGGFVGLPNFASRPFSVGNAVNNAGIVVGTGSTTLFGSSPLPLIWQGGVVSQLALPGGFTDGRAFDINNSNVAVGSVGSGVNERGVVYSGGGAAVIDITTPGGSFMTSAFGVNDTGLVVGIGVDPLNAARNVGMVYDTNSDSAFEVGALPGHNGAIAFAISNGGHVVGSSMLNQGSGLPFIWTEGGGIQPIGLPAGTTQGSARAVNSSGWVVGTASGAFAVPFLYYGTDTQRLQDLIPAGSGWDLATNTFSSAMGISDNGTVIVGTGVFNGEIRAYAMVLIPAPGAGVLIAFGAVCPRRRRRR